MGYMDFRDLIVWNRAMDMTENAYNLIRKLPKEELFNLGSQMRDSAVSIPSNIAEGYGKYSDKEFIRFLRISRGSANELITQFLICLRIGYLKLEETKAIINEIDEINKMILSMINKLEKRLK